MRRLDEVLEIVTVDVFADHGAPLPAAPAMRRESFLRPSAGMDDGLVQRSRGQRRTRTTVGLDQLRTRQGAEPYTVSIATAIRTNSNWTR